MCQPSDLDLRQSGFDHGFGDRACPAHVDEAAGPACEVPASHVRESARDGRAALHGQAGEGILGGEDLAVAAHEEQLGPSSLTRHMPGRTWPPRARLPRRSIRGSMMGWGAYWRGVLVSAAGRRCRSWSCRGSQCCERMPVPSRARALLAKSTASGVPNFMSAFNLSDAVTQEARLTFSGR